MKLISAALLSASLLCGGVASASPLTAGAVRVTESDGIVVPIRENAASVLIANPDIANVQPLSDRSFFLYGKSVGATKLFVLNENDEIILEQRVVVTRSLQALQQLTRSQVSN